jgi:transcriptional regulator
MAARPTDLLQGTLDLLVLRVLASGPDHGWGLAQRILLLSRDVLQVNQGSLYPALHRLEERGFVKASWGTSDTNRRARFYELTPAGRRALARGLETWKQYTDAVQLVIEGA